MHFGRKILLFAVVILLTTLSATAYLGNESSGAWVVDVKLQSQIYLSTPRPIQDVFVILNNTTPNVVYRIERNQANDSTILAKEVYATINNTPHDPYKITSNPLGPFPKGADLGFTLGDWIAAIGTGVYSEEGDNGTINISFSRLVPNGTYSVWIARVTMPPNYREVLIPIGASDGSQNVFETDAKGNANFSLKLKALPPSTNVSFKNYAAMYVSKSVPITENITWTLISVIYHSDGKIPGVTPGEFGKTTHAQMVYLMYPKPSKNFEQWKNASAIAAMPVEKKEVQPGFEGFLALIGLLAAAFFVQNRG